MSFIAFCGAIGFLVGGANGCATGVIIGAGLLGAIQVLWRVSDNDSGSVVQSVEPRPQLTAEITSRQSPPIKIYFMERIPTYGITIEPFAVNLTGSDGDVCWSSPGWYLTSWVFSEDVSKDADTLATERYASSGEPLFGFNLGI